MIETAPVLTTSAPTAPQPWVRQWLLYLGLLALEIFAWLPDSYTKMLDWYWLGIWQGGFLAVGLWLLLSLRQYHQPWQTLGYGLDWGVAGLGLALILSTLGADVPRAAGWYLVMALGHGVLLYALRNWLGGGLSCDRLWGLLCVGGGITGLVSLGLWLPAADWQGLRNGLPFGQYRLVGGYLVLILPLMIAYAIAHRGWRMILAILGSVLLLVDLYTTASRSALVAIAIVGILGYLLSLLSLGRQFSLARLGLSTLILAGILWTAGLNPRVFATANFANVRPDVAVDLNIFESIQNRFFLWATSLNILQAHPLNGLGMGHFGRQLDEFRPLVGNLPETPQILNTPLQVLCELGLVGAIASLLLIFLVMRLWLSVLPYLEENPKAMVLIYGIGASWLGYAIASFTDYQLEHLPISTTLIFTLALLLGIAKEVIPDSVIPKSRPQRRAIQFIALSVLTSSLYLGLPVTFAAALNHAGQLAQDRGDVVNYEKRLTQAHALTPWQPNNALELAMSHWQQRQNLLATGELSPDVEQAFRQAIAKYFLWAKNTVPQDFLLQYNYAAIAPSSEAKTVIPNLETIAQKQPNAFPYTHYLLAKNYLKLKAPREIIIQTLALQVLREPHFFTFPLWETDPDLRPLQSDVYKTAIAHFETLLETLSPADSNFAMFYEQFILLKWWHQDFLGQIMDNRLSPITQALIFAESQPERSLEIINKSLEASPNDVAFKILKTWFDPNEAIALYRPNREPLIISKPQRAYPSLQQWLAAVEPAGLIEAIPFEDHAARYRNPDLVGLSAIIPPDNVRNLPMLKFLKLDQNPKQFPERDKLINQIQKTALNNFQPPPKK